MEVTWKKLCSRLGRDGNEVESDKERSDGRESEEEGVTLEHVCLCISVGDCEMAPCCIPLIDFANDATGTRADVGRPRKDGTKPPEIYLRVKICKTASNADERAKLLPMERYAKQHKWYPQLIGLLAASGPSLAVHVEKCYDGDPRKFVDDLDGLVAKVGEEETRVTAIEALRELFNGIAYKWYKGKS